MNSNQKASRDADPGHQLPEEGHARGDQEAGAGPGGASQGVHEQNKRPDECIAKKLEDI